MSRALSDKEYDRATRIFANNEYDILKFSKVPQLPEHMGQPSFYGTVAKRQE